MTPEEKAALAGRLEIANRAPRRIEALDALILELTTASIDGLTVGERALPASVGIREVGRDDTRRLMLAEDEPAVFDEVRRAVVEILERRKAEAQAEYENA